MKILSLIILSLVLGACSSEDSSKAPGVGAKNDSTSYSLSLEQRTALAQLSGLSKSQFLEKMARILAPLPESATAETLAQVLDRHFILKCEDICEINVRGKE